MLQRYGQSDTLFHPHYKRSRCYKSLTPQRRVTEKGCSTSYLSMVIEYDRKFWWLFVSHGGGLQKEKLKKKLLKEFVTNI